MRFLAIVAFAATFVVAVCLLAFIRGLSIAASAGRRTTLDMAGDDGAARPHEDAA